MLSNLWDLDMSGGGWAGDSGWDLSPWAGSSASDWGSGLQSTQTSGTTQGNVPGGSLPGVSIDPASIAQAIAAASNPAAQQGDRARFINYLESIAQQNVSAFQAGRVDKTAALQNFEQIWVTLCSYLSRQDPEWGATGIRDRQRGGRFDWFRAYLDPIAPGAQVSTGFSGGLGIFTAAGPLGLPLWVWVLAAVLILKQKG